MLLYKNDALVVTLLVANYMNGRIVIDRRSSLDILEIFGIYQNDY